MMSKISWWRVIKVHWKIAVRKNRGRVRLKILKAGMAGAMSEPKRRIRGLKKNKIAKRMREERRRIWLERLKRDLSLIVTP